MRYAIYGRNSRCLPSFDTPTFSPGESAVSSGSRSFVQPAAESVVNCYRCDTPVPDDNRYCQACGADVSGGGVASAVAVERDPELEEKLAAELEGEFVVERILGRGGMGTVFLAREVQLNRNVAIKVLPPELTYGPGMVERFKREARTAATLDHPHIVPIYRISSTGKIVWFVMKYVEGETLADVLEREPTLAPSRVIGIVGQVAEALEFAHRRGVIHRDVKPSNIMLNVEGWVTVTDFGIAKASGLEPLTGSGAMIGTPHYMSPEQCAGKAQITGASDQYSLGVMAYQMLSGRLPFVGESTIDVIKQHCFDAPPSLRELRPDLPAQLAAAVDRALYKDAERRFSTVTEFARAFTNPPRPEPDTLRLQPSVAAATKRSRWKSVAGAIGVIATIGVVGLVLWRMSAQDRQASVSSAPIESTHVTPPPSPAQPATPQSLILEPNTRTIHVGEQYVLHLKGSDGLGSEIPVTDAKWASTNPLVARVDSDGSVTGLAPGEASIEFRVAGGMTSARVLVVLAKPVPRTVPVEQFGSVLLSTHQGHRAFLYVDGQRQGLITRLSLWRVRAGTLRISIQEEGCTSWDSTITVRPSETDTIGYRDPKCRQGG